MKNSCWILLLACMVSSAVFAADRPGQSNELVISKEPLTDPLPDGDLVAYMTLNGKDAEEIYQGMGSQQEYKNVCNQEGLTARVAGNLICYKSREGSYSCNFGIRLTDGSLVLGRPC